jgi:hypothetical protein
VRPFGLSRWHYVLLLVPLGLLFTLVVLVLADRPGNEIMGWYWVDFRGPSFQRRLAFRMTEIALPSGHRWSAFTDVTPGGSLWKAGVRAGDVPIRVPVWAGNRWHLFPTWIGGSRGAQAAFYAFLGRSEGRGPVTFTVCSPDAIAPGPAGWNPPCQEREVTVSVPTP